MFSVFSSFGVQLSVFSVFSLVFLIPAVAIFFFQFFVLQLSVSVFSWFSVQLFLHQIAHGTHHS